MRTVTMMGLLIAACVACRTPPLDPAGMSAPDAAPSDFSQPVSGDGLFTMCQSYALVPQLIDKITPLELNLTAGTLIRVSVQYQRLLCDYVGPIDVVLDSTGAVVVSAYVWHTPGCTDGSAFETRTVFLSEKLFLPPGKIVVRDGAGRSPPVTLQIRPAAMATCMRSTPTCQLDCQCQAADAQTRCWLDSTECKRICTADRDCLAASPHCNQGFCSTQLAPCTAVLCPFGQRCSVLANGPSCVPVQVATPGEVCDTNDVCGVGAFCSDCGCVLPCAVDGDCPAGRTCSRTGCQ